MPAERKRETRGNQVYNVGVQGRKTGITLEDKGVRDEHGMEPISAIFSSPAKSPPKRSASLRQTGGTVTDSESMDLDSSVPNLTPGRLLRGNVPNLPPPKSRSPMKTTLGSSPRRQSSMGPRAQGQDEKSSGSNRAASHPAVSRRLDFEQDESSLQETPALSGSGTRRGRARRDVYELEHSPSQPPDSIVEESMVQEDDTINEDSVMINGVAEESFAGVIAEDSVAGAEAEIVDTTMEAETVVVEPVKQPAKRGRKRKSDAIATPNSDESPALLPRKRGSATAQASAAAQDKASSQSTTAKPRRTGKPRRVSEIIEEESSTSVDESPGASGHGKKSPVSKPRGRPPRNRVDDSLVDSEQAEETSAPAKKRRGRPAKAPTEEASSANKEASQPVFKKPKAIAKAKSRSDATADAKARDKTADRAIGTLIDQRGAPLTKDEIEQMSTTSTSSRFGRGRSLSIFRQLAPDQVGRVPTTGRHKMEPVNWWANERARYDKEGSLKALNLKEEEEEVPRKHTSRRKAKGKKRGLGAIEEEEEEEVELEEWEKDEGVLSGTYRDWVFETELPTDQIYESSIAWAPKGIEPREVASGEFKFTKLASSDPAFFSFGFIEMDPGGLKRAKNSRGMHMAFHVTQGAVEAMVDNNVFTIHKGGVWHVPKGESSYLLPYPELFSPFYAMYFGFYRYPVHRKAHILSSSLHGILRLYDGGQFTLVASVNATRESAWQPTFWRNAMLSQSRTVACWVKRAAQASSPHAWLVAGASCNSLHAVQHAGLGRFLSFVRSLRRGAHPLFVFFACIVVPDPWMLCRILAAFGLPEWSVSVGSLRPRSKRTDTTLDLSQKVSSETKRQSRQAHNETDLNRAIAPTSLAPRC
ncbi:hypothetical protein K491DRAFT_674981 [Lophiostoma macrostomum CBS 122681]|uniref:Mif2/CENP-C cupin domain-containing protein n=1 Tax=Lophiostoma macrostomum CBS 122681 TaxID=1314788 RepID=A0A6A6TJY7_9PLEO|nr:hypothetical protein K491DRAFT_674981 [Lophiostoma macrostomum CBS 122681]